MADPSTAEPMLRSRRTPRHRGFDRARTPTPDANAAPSAAEKSETKETLLEAVLKAVKPAEDAEEGRSRRDFATLGERLPDPTPKRRRGQGRPNQRPVARRTCELTTNAPASASSKLLGERNGFRAEAEVTQTLRNFLVTNDIAREDFQLTLDLAAAMRRGDFKAFLEGVGPYVQLATQALGITLPPDLQNEVQQKRVTFDAAAQMSRDRYARALAEQRATRATQVVNTQQTTAQTQHLQRSIEQTVAAGKQASARPTRIMGARKKPFGNFFGPWCKSKGAPRSPEHAVEIAKEAYARANRTFAPIRAPTPTHQSQFRAASTTAPRQAHARNRSSLMEAAELGTCACSRSLTL